MATSFATSLVILAIFPLILKTVGNDRLQELLQKDSPGYTDIYNYVHIFSLFCIFSLGGVSVIEKIYKAITGTEFDRKALEFKTAKAVSDKLLKYREEELSIHAESSDKGGKSPAGDEEKRNLLTNISKNKYPISEIKSKLPSADLIGLERDGLIKLIFDIEEMDYAYAVTDLGSDFISKTH